MKKLIPSLRYAGCRPKRIVAALMFIALAGCAINNPGASEATVQQLLVGQYQGNSTRGSQFHTIIAIEAPRYGSDVYYHHISTIAFNGPAVMRKVYSFEPSGRLMKSVVPIVAGVSLVDTATIAAELQRLPEEDLLRFPESCAFQWEQTDDTFVGSVSRATCAYNSPAFGGTVHPEMRYSLGDDGLNIYEAIYRDNGDPVFPPSNVDNRRVR